ncbi:MAG: hypothetical protein EOM20_21590, partial [Spartobacteria bacterium]|nr:hypothetical protein [Spartobacteria bacterium]
MKMIKDILVLLVCVMVCVPCMTFAQIAEPQLPDIPGADGGEPAIELPTLPFSDWTDNDRQPVVYIIPINNMIEPALLYVIRRGVSEAENRNAAAIIFVMDTPGGRVDVTGDILRIIQNISVPTYTYIEKDAYSAGAIIALGTKHIYMAPGSVIGAATPMMMTPGGGVQDLPDEVEEKMVSGVAAKVRAAAEQGGHDTQLAEAMVRRDMEYKIGDTVISEKGEL